MSVRLTEQKGLRQVEKISPEQLNPDVVKRLPWEFLKKQCAIPILLTGGEMAVALADPLNLEAYDAIVGILGRACPRVVCPAPEIEQAISRCYYYAINMEEKYFSPDSPEGTEPAVSDNVSTVQTHAEDLISIAQKAPAVQLVNKILFHAVRSRASDIHIEPYERDIEVRFRIDGILYKKLAPPKIVQEALISRVKIVSGLNIAEKRLPQDGRIRVVVAGRDIDIRVSIVPTFFGERVVLRLLDKQKGVLSLEDIGLSPAGVTLMERLLARSNGIVLVTGPTGSGKSTTLYAALNRINSAEKNIITIEDPIEYQLKGVGQIQVNPKIDLTFANGLRSILRQDPDIIMVGEIRDVETAEIAIQASLTGHLVLSTLHTNDSATAITRLVDMGIEPFMVASSLSAVLAQRLVRLICPHCREEYAPERMYPGIELPPKLYRGTGCEKCFGLGTMGRTI